MASVQPPAKGPSLPSLVRRPALITLCVTLLRLAGEKLGGAPELFDTVAGGGAAIVGIAWLVPVFGFVFGWKLYSRGVAPPPLRRAIGLPLAALLLAPLVVWLGGLARSLSWTAHLAWWGAASAVAALVAVAAWPALGRLLAVYALLARVPVALVMAAAMAFSWGTHYDALPPGFPAMSVLARWLWLGLLPQLTIWVALTIAVGSLCALAGWYVARYRDGV